MQQAAPDLMKQWEDAAEGISSLDEFIGTIDTAYFEKNSTTFSDGNVSERVRLIMDVAIDQSIDPPDFRFESTKLYFSVGSGDNWNVLDGGDKLAAAKQGAQMGNSQYQGLISRVIKDLKCPLPERGMTPFEAGVWIGLKFHWKREQKEIPQRLRREGGPSHSTIILPQEWLQNALPR